MNSIDRNSSGMFTVPITEGGLNAENQKVTSVGQRILTSLGSFWNAVCNFFASLFGRCSQTAENTKKNDGFSPESSFVMVNDAPAESGTLHVEVFVPDELSMLKEQFKSSQEELIRRNQELLRKVRNLETRNSVLKKQLDRANAKKPAVSETAVQTDLAKPIVLEVAVQTDPVEPADCKDCKLAIRGLQENVRTIGRLQEQLVAARVAPRVQVPQPPMTVARRRLNPPSTFRALAWSKAKLFGEVAGISMLVAFFKLRGVIHIFGQKT